MELLSYDSVDLAEVLPRIPRRGRDRMTFGIIELDYDGVIIAYNMGEAKVSGRNPKDMVGRNFFSDIAPCTRTPEFYGRFKAGTKTGNLNARFDFVFSYAMEPTAVRVTMITSVIDGLPRVLVLIRILTDEELARSGRDHERIRVSKAQAAAPKPVQVPAPLQAPAPVEMRAPVEMPAPQQMPAPVQMPAPAPAPVSSFAISEVAPGSDEVEEEDYFDPYNEPPPPVHKPRPKQLLISELEAIASGKGTLLMDEGLSDRLTRASAALDQVEQSGVPIYGLTTGFGPLALEVAAPEGEHQIGLIRHLATGVGRPFSVEQTRAAMVARLKTLSLGHSAVSMKVIEALNGFLEQGLTPVVPQLGTVGASGDLTPLAHLAMALCGEGEVFVGLQRRSAQSVMSERGLVPLKLRRRDGLALVNGCSFTTGVAALNGARARRLLRWTLCGAAGYAQVLRAQTEALNPLHALVRPHGGQILAREQLAVLHEGSTRLRESAEAGPPQDAYSLRCQSQLIGAVIDALDHHDNTVEVELNAVSDNPIIDGERNLLVHGGNFFGQHVGFVSDYLRIALTQLGAWSERAIARLVDPALNDGLPPQLRGRNGQSGLMGLQVSATALLAEIKTLATPASIQGISTNCNNQDVVPMATMAARHSADAIEHLAHLTAMLWITVAQAMDLKPDGYSDSVMACKARVREISPVLREDRMLSHEINVLAQTMLRQDPPLDASLSVI